MQVKLRNPSVSGTTCSPTAPLMPASAPQPAAASENGNAKMIERFELHNMASPPLQLPDVGQWRCNHLGSSVQCSLSRLLMPQRRPRESGASIGKLRCASL